MNKEKLLQRLEKVQQLAQGGPRRRLLHNPLRYLRAMLYRRLLYPRFSSGLRQNVPTFFGRRMAIRLPAAMDIFLLGAKTHDSEIRLSRFLIHRLEPGDVFVDVGAHFGFYTLLGALLCGEQGKVLALEASPLSFGLLENNVRLLPQVRAMHLAAADQEGQLAFYEFPTLFSEYNSSNLNQYDDSEWRPAVQPRRVQVPAQRLDTLLAEIARHPKIIKIDVEGGELEVLRGLSGLLSGGDVPMLVMEYLAPGRNNDAHRKARRYLEQFGYQPHVIEADSRISSCPDPDAYLKHRRLDSDNLLFLRSAR